MKMLKKILIQNFIMPKFDYCDIIYIHMNNDLKNQLQKIQNICVRFIYNLKKYDHISMFYIRLNWLKLEQRRLLHFGCLIYKMYLYNSPSYLTDMIVSTKNVHNHNTRSQLFIPQINNSFGKMMFKFYASQFWNSIPMPIRKAPTFNIFKSQLIEYIINNLL